VLLDFDGRQRRGKRLPQLVRQRREEIVHLRERLLQIRRFRYGDKRRRHLPCALTVLLGHWCEIQQSHASGTLAIGRIP